MSDDEGLSRSERLRRRRQSSKDRASERAEPSESSKASKPSKPSERDEPSEPSKTSVKEEQVGTYMYLPESQKKTIDRLYVRMSADYELEFDEDLEKNRHFFPLLVEYGLDGLDGLDASEVRDRLDDLHGPE